jgi:hypothetical protein
MKKLILSFLFILTTSLVIGQNYGVGLKNPREAYNVLDSEGKDLLQECSRIVGIPIDSMCGVPDSLYNTFKYVANQYNVKVVVVSNYQINYTPNTNTTLFSGTTVVEDYHGKDLEKPLFMVFIYKHKEGMMVTLQMYY